MKLAPSWAIAASTMGSVLLVSFCAFVGLADLSIQDESDVNAWLGRETNLSELAEEAADEPRLDIRVVEVKRGDTLAELLIDEGASAEDARQAIAALDDVYDPTEIRGGQSVSLTFSGRRSINEQMLLLSVALKPNVERDIDVVRNVRGLYAAKETIKQLTAVGTRASGTIEGSLYQSSKDAGIPDGVIVNLIGIYSHAVDFQREVRHGDKFDVLYTKYVDEHGVTLKSGAIEYAALTLSGESKPLYRYTSREDQSSDYYTPSGSSGRRFLMRTPIDGARLTSGYGVRTHPVLGYTKMHKGVDFAAPSGTPIMAAGNGSVELARWLGTFGKYIRVKHANGYETAYAHMSRFAPGIREGSRVRQGQTIGYVGTTGRSTGPHLHYEVFQASNQLNPMSVKLPTGMMLSAIDLEAFKMHAQKIDTALANWGTAPALVAQGEILRSKLLP